MILIKNGLVKTMAGEDIENGQVLLDGDKIAAVGKEVNAIPELMFFPTALGDPSLKSLQLLIADQYSFNLFFQKINSLQRRHHS